MNEKHGIKKENVLMRMMDICSRSEKCSYDIRLKLEQYPLKDPDKEWIMNRLEEEKFIDDRRYADFFVKDKFRLNRWGKLKIRQALFMKHLDEAIIQDSLQNIDGKEYSELLFKLILAKSRELKDRNIYQKKGKLFRFAAQRGFEAELIHEAIVRCLSE